MNLYVMRAMYDEDSDDERYCSSFQQAYKVARDLIKDAFEGLAGIEIEKFTLVNASFKETVIRCLNKRRFVEANTREVVYKWERKDKSDG